MNIYALKGHKVMCRYLSDKGYNHHQEIAKKHLELNKTYTVEKTVVYKYHTDVYLQEFPDIEFNSVFFEDVSLQTIEDDKKHLDYFRYH